MRFSRVLRLVVKARAKLAVGDDGNLRRGALGGEIVGILPWLDWGWLTLCGRGWWGCTVRILMNICVNL